jgi:NAD(P)-dependent dehydrogenase (short-subunit alcohol dehydrogenase family)
MGRLEGKVALVVGGGSDGPPAPGEDLPIGNGRAAAISVGREGAAVAVADRSPEAAEETAGQIRAEGGEAVAVECDVMEDEQCAAAVAATTEEFGALHLVVNNVGIADLGGVTQTSVEEFDEILAVNVRGHFLALRHAVPEIAKSGGGAIATISSLNALVSGAGIAYETSKAALLGMSRQIAVTCAPQGIRANVVIPGVIDSTMLRRFVGDQEIDFVSAIPLGRMGTPWDVAKATVFLLSDEAEFVTGTQLVVDGGQSARM